MSMAPTLDMSAALCRRGCFFTTLCGTLNQTFYSDYRKNALMEKKPEVDGTVHIKYHENIRSSRVIYYRLDL